MAGSITERLVETLSRPIADDTRGRTILHLLDWTACAAVGATEAPARPFLAYGGTAEKGSSTAIFCGRRSAPDAALVNGALGNILEMDDLHRESIVHPGDVVVPAALAAAEREGCSGARLLDAIVRGYDTAIRIGVAAGAEHYRYWYNTATCGVFGAAAACASIMQLDAGQTVNALGLAGMQATGFWQCRLETGEAKQLATAHAARAGLLAADLARSGSAGPHRILEGELGFFRATAPGADAAAVPGDGEWLILETSFKPWPACRHAHPVIALALQIRARLDPTSIGLETVEWVEIRTYKAAVDFCDDPFPDTAHRGRFSLQHAFAAAFLYGTPEMDFAEPAMLRDPAVAALRQRISVKEDPVMTAAFPGRYPAGLELTLASGQSIEAEVSTAPGDPENPISEDQLRDKHRMLLHTAGLNDAQIEALLGAAAALPEARDMKNLSAALQPLTSPARRKETVQ